MGYRVLLGSDVRRRIRRTSGLFVAVTATALSMAGQASAQDPGPGGRAGIDKAKTAGIAIDPAVEAMMARAPEGSCPNDPTQAKCGKLKAVVYAPEFFGVENPPTTSASASKVSRKIKRLRAHASYITQCIVNVSDQSPYKAAGYAQVDAKQYCSAAVTVHYLYALALKWYNGQYVQMKTVASDSRPGNSWAYASARYYCTATVSRYWQGRADGYASLKGVLYGGSFAHYRYLNCG